MKKQQNGSQSTRAEPTISVLPDAKQPSMKNPKCTSAATLPTPNAKDTATSMEAVVAAAADTKQVPSSFINKVSLFLFYLKYATASDIISEPF